ncbi:alpha/beta fold hydrolase [Persicimonas caeni]|uniref:alpha/beta fold hydrolase n=1 Tax=Persicimonas caeni TaxID=2292766 RepID=UPI00143D13F0|nr:alpha/beta hydrolase [Persicimonas caeni]
MDRSSFLSAEDGTQIWYGTAGTGPAIVLCDGLACDGFIWPYVVDEFVNAHTIVRWHYRGHGQSDAPEDLSTLNIPQMARDLDAVLDALELDSAVLVGHSMGVQVILEYYGLNPDRVAALVPICGSYKRPLDTLYNTDFFGHALPHLMRLVESVPEASQTFWQTVVPSKFSYILSMATAVNTRLARGVDFIPYLEHVGDMDIRVFLTLLSAVAEHSAEDVLERVDAPALIIAGEKDELTPLFRSEEMADQIADSELIVLPGGTHVGPIELPELVNGAIEKFLRKVGLGT